MPGRRSRRIRALAKINLSLRIVGARADGYHELQTVFQSIALHDTLVLRANDGPFALECGDPACPVDRRNLVWRAAERVWRAAGRRGSPRGFVIELTKRIPIEAGLGGGSSDAAAAVRLLGGWLGVGEEAQRDVAAALGADVPYFLEGGTALGLDRGDLLFPLLDEPKAWVALAVPGFGVSTKEAFSWWDQSSAARRSPKAGRGSHALMNDLEAPVARRHPVIGRLVRALKRAGAAHAAMSGSGSAVFGLFDDRPAAERAGRRLGRGVRVFITPTVGRKAYRRLTAIG